MSIKRAIPLSVLYPFGPPERAGLSDASSRPRPCAVSDCRLPGEYRAPRDRSLLDYMWLCLDHVRQHNRSWNYYKNMSAEELEAHIRLDVCWQRPSWRLGSIDDASPVWRSSVRDPFGFVHAAENTNRADKRNPLPVVLSSEEEKALRTLDLTWPLTRQTLRARFIELAKRYHPDLNPGDKNAENRLKEIIRAYHALGTRL